MNRKLLIALLLVGCLLIFTGCCSHEVWLAADCVNPKTCENCGETDGTALGHTWQAATCTAPKTCEVCHITEGEAKGHSWTDATCITPKICENCKETQGDSLGHSWAEATTEAPKTCTVCNITEGERIVTDPRFTTAACKDLFGKWQLQLDLPGERLTNGMAAYVDVLPCILTIEFCNNGTAKLSFMPVDEAQMKDIVRRYTIDLMYQQFAQAGMNAQQAQQAMQQTYGMTIEAYVAAEVAKMNISELFNVYTVNYVYYVSGNQLYLGFSWSNALSPAPFSIEGNNLTIEADLKEDGSGKATLKKVTE